MRRHLSLLLAMIATAAAQEAPPPSPPPATRQAAPPAPPPPRATRGPVATKPVDDVDRYRDGQTAPVTRASAVFDLDLSRVDLAADPLLLIDGAPLTSADLDRQLCLVLGHNEIEQFVTAVLLRRVQRAMEAAGEAVPKLEITEEDVKRKFEEEKELRGQMPGITPAEFERQIKEVFGWERYVDLQRQQMAFERFFLPFPPPDWAAKQQAEAKRLADEHKQKLEAAAKQEAEKAAGDGAKPPAAKQDPPPLPPADLSFVPARTWTLLDERATRLVQDNYARGVDLHAFVRAAVVPGIRRKLLEGVELRTGRPEDGDAVVVCGGEPLPMRDLLALLAGRIDDASRRITLRELVNLRAADARLARDQALVSEADADAALAEFRKRYAGTIVPAEFAVTALGFNSVWHYREYFRRKHSYELLVARQIDDAKITTHAAKSARLFFENGTCIAQVLFVPGADRATARSEIDAALARVAAGKSFGAVARESGRFPDGGDAHGGALAPLLRGRLRQALGEDEYTTFLTGYSFADEAFYSAREDSILGPVWRDLTPAFTGWFALHVDRFFTTGARAALDAEKERERALDDYCDVTFPRYVNEALLRCRIDLPARAH